MMMSMSMSKGSPWRQLEPCYVLRAVDFPLDLRLEPKRRLSHACDVRPPN